MGTTGTKEEQTNTRLCWTDRENARDWLDGRNIMVDAHADARTEYKVHLSFFVCVYILETNELSSNNR